MSNYYAKNKQKHIKVVNDARNEVRRDVFEYLLDHPCVDCGEPDPVFLDFDHIESKGAKIAPITKMISNGYCWENILLEIAKCEVRCSNCHRRATAKRNKNSSHYLRFKWYQEITGIISEPDESNKEDLQPQPARKTKAKHKISKEVLSELVWKKPIIHIAKDLGVSDKAVAKWCIQWGIDRPEPGYWNKQKINLDNT